MLEPNSIVYEGDIIPCDITGDPTILYWTINNLTMHDTFHQNNPIIFNPDPTPLEDTTVEFSVYAGNNQGISVDTIPIQLKRLFFGDIHWHSNCGDGEFDLDTMYQNAIDDNYLDFTACTEHGTMICPLNGNHFLFFQKILNIIMGNDAWDLMKEKAIQYYDPGSFTTFLAFEWSASDSYPGGYHFSKDGVEDVAHINFYYRDVYSEAQKYSPFVKRTFDEIFNAMMDEYENGHKNLAFPHHPQGKVYYFNSSINRFPFLNNFEFLNKLTLDYTTNFSYLANNIQNKEARDSLLRGVEVYSRWGTAIGKYSDIPMTWPYFPDNVKNVIVSANKTCSWVENAMWEWSDNEMKDTVFSMQAGSDTHHIDRPGSAYLWRVKPSGLMAAYSTHNTREELWDAMDQGLIYGTQLLKIRANVRFDDQMAYGTWINCTRPLTINISAFSTFPGVDTSGRRMYPDNYSDSELDYPISDIWIVKKDNERGKPWCKVVQHIQPHSNLVIETIEDADVQPNDFYYIIIQQQGQELAPDQDQYSAFIGPVFIDSVFD